MSIRAIIYLLFIGASLTAQTPVMIMGGGVAPPAEASGDSTILAEVWYQFENNSADSSGNAVDGTYSGGYDAGIYKQGSYGVEFEASDIWTFDSFTLNDTFDIIFWYYHESAETESYTADLARRGNTTDGWSLEFDQINGDVEFHKFVSGTDYEARTFNGLLDVWHDDWLFVVIQVSGPTIAIWLDNLNVTNDVDPIVDDYQTGVITMGATVNSTVDSYQIYNFNTTPEQRTYLMDHPEQCLKSAD